MHEKYKNIEISQIYENDHELVFTKYFKNIFGIQTYFLVSLLVIFFGLGKDACMYYNRVHVYCTTTVCCKSLVAPKLTSTGFAALSATQHTITKIPGIDTYIICIQLHPQVPKYIQLYKILYWLSF